MRTCIVFRGENLRHKRGLTSALECVDNWKETILDVIDCDVVFFTYPSEILEELTKLSPVHVCTSGYDSHETNVLAAINWMVENKDQYDRFVFLRFDIMYRLRINKWPQWDQKGILIVNKDVHHCILQIYADIVFVVDSDWVNHFKDAFVAEGKYRCALHHIGRYLEQMPDVPLHVMYPGYYHMVKHPLHALHPWEPKPNLNEYYQGEEILDLSPWIPWINSQPVVQPIQHRVDKRQQHNTAPKKKNNTTTIRSRPFVIFNKKK